MLLNVIEIKVYYLYEIMRTILFISDHCSAAKKNVKYHVK